MSLDQVHIYNFYMLMLGRFFIHIHVHQVTIPYSLSSHLAVISFAREFPSVSSTVRLRHTSTVEKPDMECMAVSEGV